MLKKLLLLQTGDIRNVSNISYHFCSSFFAVVFYDDPKAEVDEGFNQAEEEKSK